MTLARIGKHFAAGGLVLTAVWLCGGSLAWSSECDVLREKLAKVNQEIATLKNNARNRQEYLDELKRRRDSRAESAKIGTEADKKGLEDAEYFYRIQTTIMDRARKELAKYESDAAPLREAVGLCDMLSPQQRKADSQPTAPTGNTVPTENVAPTDSVTSTSLTTPQFVPGDAGNQPTDNVTPAPLPPVHIGGYVPASKPSPGGGDLPKVWCVIYRDIPSMTPAPAREWAVALPKDIPWLGSVWQTVECNLTFPEAHKKRTELAGGPPGSIPPSIAPTGGPPSVPLPPVAVGPMLPGPGGGPSPQLGSLPPQKLVPGLPADQPLVGCDEVEGAIAAANEDLARLSEEIVQAATATVKINELAQTLNAAATDKGNPFRGEAIRPLAAQLDNLRLIASKGLAATEHFKLKKLALNELKAMKAKCDGVPQPPVAANTPSDSNPQTQAGRGGPTPGDITIALGGPLGGPLPPTGLIPPQGGDVLPPISINTPPGILPPPTLPPPGPGSTGRVPLSCGTGTVLVMCRDPRAPAGGFDGRGDNACVPPADAMNWAKAYRDKQSNAQCTVNGKPVDLSQPPTAGTNCPPGTVRLTCTWQGQARSTANECYSPAAGQQVAKNYNGAGYKCLVDGKPVPSGAPAVAMPVPPHVSDMPKPPPQSAQKRTRPRHGGQPQHNPTDNVDWEAVGAALGTAIGAAGGWGGGGGGGGYGGGGGGMQGHHR